MGYLTDTGEAFAVGLMPPVAPVEVLGVVVEQAGRMTFDAGLPRIKQSRTLHAVLEGWIEQGGRS